VLAKLGISAHEDEEAPAAPANGRGAGGVMSSTAGTGAGISVPVRTTRRTSGGGDQASPRSVAGSKSRAGEKEPGVRAGPLSGDSLAGPEAREQAKSTGGQGRGQAKQGGGQGREGGAEQANPTGGQAREDGAAVSTAASKGKSQPGQHGSGSGQGGSGGKGNGESKGDAGGPQGGKKPGAAGKPQKP
jgi:hypothetical protein